MAGDGPLRLVAEWAIAKLALDEPVNERGNIGGATTGRDTPWDGTHEPRVRCPSA